MANMKSNDLNNVLRHSNLINIHIHIWIRNLW